LAHPKLLTNIREGCGGHLRFALRVFLFPRIDTARLVSAAKMYRTVLRSAAPSALRAARPTLASGSRRFASTAPAKKKGTWKGTGLRWGLAIGAVYFYNTSPLFADELPGAFLNCKTPSHLANIAQLK
jgi:hypothetical protein